MTLIPKGARHIRAAHRSRNHLGISGWGLGGAGCSLQTEAWGGGRRGGAVGGAGCWKPGLTLLSQR